MRTIRKAACGAVTVGLLAATAACGSSGSGGTAKSENADSAIFDALSASQQKVSDIEGISFETTMTMSDPSMEPPMEFSFSMSGAMNVDPVAMDVSMDMTAFMQMLAEAFGAPPEEFPGEFVMNMRLVDGEMYMGGALFEEELGGAWVKIEMDSAEAAQFQQQLDQAEQMSSDPSADLSLLLESPDVEWKGTETIEGVEADHYSGTLSLSDLAALDESSGLSQEEIDQQVDELRAMGADEVELSFWVDQNDLPVRFDMTMGMAEGGMTMSTIYKEFGEAVDIQAPAEGDYVDVSTLPEGFNPFGPAA